MEDAGTVLFDHVVVRFGAVAFMLLETILRVLLRKVTHQTVAEDLRRDGRERDDRDERVAVDDGFLRVFRRRAKRAVELYFYERWVGCKGNNAARKRAAYRRYDTFPVDHLCVFKFDDEACVAPGAPPNKKLKKKLKFI